ncbi:MAG: hypothetical protein ACTSVI_13250 [Promethearchaeota archaeon]
MVMNELDNILVNYEQLSIREEKGFQKIELTELNDSEKETINPIVPPTSGIRIKLLKKENDHYNCLSRDFYLFLRIFKAISIQLKELLKKPANILITSDERPTSDQLIKQAFRIFAKDGHDIFVQNEKEEKIKFSNFYHSGLSTPYTSASIAMDEKLDAAICITASHNSIIWNGIKFYYKYPIPIAGNLMRAISEKAINLKSITIENEEKILLNGKNYQTLINKKMKEFVKNIIPIETVKNAPIIIWPYLGDAKGINELLTSFGADVRTIKTSMEPPDPTTNFPENDIKKHMEENNSKIAIMLDADRDRIVFYIKSKDEYLKMTPNELYTAMHNILAKEFNKLLINVRTVPSDPRSDEQAICTIETGVGYKHLGVVLYSACGLMVDPSQASNALIYGQEKNSPIKLKSPTDLIDFINLHAGENKKDPYLMNLWEESGGHAINILQPILENNKIIKFTSRFPLIGDKFPAPAIVLLCELLSRGYKLLDYLDPSIKGSRVKIEADDHEKKAIMNSLEKMVGKKIMIGDHEYDVLSYSDNNGKLDIIHLLRENTKIYIRPSGTGNSVRIYIFGNEKTNEREMEDIANFIKKI